jgi:hypothetical protein
MKTESMPPGIMWLPRGPQEIPRGPLEAPKGPQEAPNGPMRLPEFPKRCPRGPQEVILVHLGATLVVLEVSWVLPGGAQVHFGCYL